MLNDATIRNLKAPAKGQKIYFDGTLPGFGCRVSQGGKKTLVLVVGKDRRWITIGQYPIISLQEARSEAKKLLAEFTLGKSRPQSIGYQQAVALFIADKKQSKRPSTVYGYARLLGKLKFKSKLAEITHEEAGRKVAAIKAPSERSHVLVAGKVFFNWCMNRRMISDNPLRGISKPKANKRKRVLTPEEIQAIWGIEGDFADYLKLLLLTGQRRSEMKHAIVGKDTFTIPSEIAKNHTEVIIPLTAWARCYCRPYKNFDWGYEKRKFDIDCGVIDWQIHDCRRTFKTNCSRLRVPPHVSERILNHISSRGPLEDTYDLHGYLPEMREAMEKWEEYLEGLLKLRKAA